jgi:GABA(A) receptor-associated protein
MNFKKTYTFEARLNESIKIKNKYLDRLPIICEKMNNINNYYIPNINKKKYLAPIDLTIGQFLYVIRNKINLSAEKAIFLFVGGIIPINSANILEIYSKYKDLDGFLYFTYSSENTFG